MFTFSCFTCEAKLVVKDETLVGKILACPNCGCMVLVQSPAIVPEPPPPSPKKPTVHKRFPDLLTHGTSSGVIGHVPEENRRSALLLEAVPETMVSGTEVKTRKILVGILVGLFVFLLAALGFLMVFQKPEHSPPVQVPNLQVPAEPLPVVPPIEPDPVLAEDVGTPPPDEASPTIPPQDPPIEPEPIQNETDTLSAFEEKMPGFVDISVPNIDINAKLALPILELHFNQHPPSLIGFVQVMSGMTEIPMTLDIDEMKTRSISIKTPVAAQFHETTAEKILTETLETLGLQWTAMDRQILIHPKAVADAADLTFDISDFAKSTNDLTPEVLADMIRQLVLPEANVTVLPDNRLSVIPDESSRRSLLRQRDEVQRFLEQLRVIRHLPQKTEWAGETLAPEAFGWDHVMEPITLNYYRAVPLSRVVRQLESLTKLTILVDHRSLHRSLCSFASLWATAQCDQGTVNDAMELLLASVDSVALAYRIIDHETLEITTAESVRQPEKMAVEVHQYQLREGETPEEFARLLHSAVAPESWRAAELPETKYAGNIVVDTPSNCLLIRQSQPVQRQIRLYLSESELLTP